MSKARIIFLPDRSVDAEGDLFYPLLQSLGLSDFEVNGDPQGAEFVAFVGNQRATEIFGYKPKSGMLEERWHGAHTYVLPSTALACRPRFFESSWRDFAVHVLGTDLAVRDDLKGMTPDEIRAHLDARRFEFAILIANVAHDVNVGSMVRTANAMLASEILIYGRRRTNMRAAMGCHNYERITHIENIDALAQHLEEKDRTLVCCEQDERAVPLWQFEWPARPLIAFGHEGPGIPAEVRELSAHMVIIEQYGSVRSLNAGVCAGIAMFDWHAKRMRAERQ